MRAISHALFASLLLCFAVAARADQPIAHTIVTTGESSVYVTPDEVVVSFGVEVFDESLDKAKTENDKRSTSLIKAINDLGVDQKQIQTDALQIEIQYNRTRPWEGIRGYVVRRAYSVTLKETKLFEKLVDSALRNGANEFSGFDFRTAALRKYRDQARMMAIKAAKEKAVALAKELDCGVGKPWQIFEGDASASDLSLNSTSNASQNAARAGNGGGEESHILPSGQIAIRAVVTVTFDLTDK